MTEERYRSSVTLMEEKLNSSLEIKTAFTFQALFIKGFCLFLKKRQNPFVERVSEYTLLRVTKERYVLQAGRVVQQGSFEELAAREGLFAQLMQRQMA